MLTDRAQDFIGREGPFMLFIAHKAVHPDARQLDDGSSDPNINRVYTPGPWHKGRYEDRVYPKQPNVVTSPDDLDGKPALQRSLRHRDSRESVAEFSLFLDPGTSEETIRRPAEMVLAVDEGLGRMEAALETGGVLDNTMIMFTSDNGFFPARTGSARSAGCPTKSPSGSRSSCVTRRWPRPGSRIGGLSLSVDIAPTVLDVGRVEIGEHVQGRFLAPLLRGEHRVEGVSSDRVLHV